MADACAPQSSFQKVFGERYRRVEALTKPVMITELGIQGEDTYRAGWLAQALTSLQRYPLVKTVVYFNARDSAAAWGNACPIPDWRVEPSLFRLP
jgi:cellulose synthase (UDP-forming)